MRFITLLCLFTLAAALPARADLKIMTTLTDYADLAKQIGREHVTVRSVMQGPENIHNVFAKPTEMLFLNKADLFVHSGLDTEPWRDNLVKGGRNPRIMPGKPGDVDMSQGIELKDVPAGRIDRSMGDVHAFGNPHYMGHPANVARMIATLTRKMADADPNNAAFYRGNAKKLVIEIADLHKELLRQFEPHKGLKVVTFHDAWKYFADAFSISIVTTIEPKPMITPSPAEMKQVIETMKREGVKIVIVETYNSREQAKYVADAAGAQLLVLPDHVNGVHEASSYQALFRYNIGKLIEAAKAGGQ